MGPAAGACGGQAVSGAADTAQGPDVEKAGKLTQGVWASPSEGGRA